MKKILEVKSLKKSYGSIKAVKEIDFYVEEGKLFAFLGPNGAGKSTTIDILCTQLKADSGEVIIDGKTLGKDDYEIRKSIGVVFQNNILDPLLTVKENLMIRGSFYKIPKARLKENFEKAVETTNSKDFLNQKYGKLSGGQKRRADIARALINTPKILFLDEPTTGLDPQTRKSIWETVRMLQKENNMTVFLTTHYMEEASEANYVIVIKKGEIAAKGTPTDLRQNFSSDVLKMQTKNMEALTSVLNSNNINYNIIADIAIINLENTLEAMPILEKCKEFVTNVEILNGTLDDAFINIIGKEIKE